MSDFAKRISGVWDSTDVNGTDFNFGDILNKDTMLNTNNDSSSMATLNKNLETQNSLNSDFFSAKNLGSTLSSVGAIAGALANVYGVKQQQKFNKDMLNMEKNRVEKENQRRDTAQSNYDKVWGN
ncbi:hypothetical protein ACNSOO_04730 [Aliarcobacter lanthieri]|uniref:hypothetical protein n=1 Tax=Aliarcobacter lanthieri TaxID=1355374 RepID=UPI003AB06B49